MTLIGIKPYDKNKYKQEQEKLSMMRRMRGISNYDRSSASDAKNSSQYGAFAGDTEILEEFIEQESRLGNYERIFPCAYNAEYYSKFFERDRLNNDLL